MSQRLSPTASRWSTRDQEAYTIFACITKWSSMLLGHPFTVYTDHRNLTFIMKAQEGRVYRWKIALQQFVFEVVHINGVDNTVADSLSRNCSASEPPIPNTVIAAVAATPSWAWIEPPYIEVLMSVHNSLVGHLGVNATIDKLHVNGHHWSTMRRDVILFIQNCPDCQKLRVTDQAEVAKGFPQVIEAYEPFQRIAIDTLEAPIDEDGYKYVLLASCMFCRFVELGASCDKSAKSWALFLLRVFCRYGAPQTISSDQGSEFVNDIMAELTTLFKCTQRFTIGYRPQANGIAERANREILRHLRAIVLSDRVKKFWSLALPIVQRIMNALKSSATGYAPSTIVYGACVNLDRGLMAGYKPSKQTTYSDYVLQFYQLQVQCIAASQRHLAIKHDKITHSGSAHEIDVGSYVVLSRLETSVDTKLDAPYTGPYLVVSRVHNSYTLQDLRTAKKFVADASRLRAFQLAEGVDPLKIAALDVDEDVVDVILDHRTPNLKAKKQYEFKVKFVDSTEVWLPYMQLRNNAALDVYIRDKPALLKIFS